MQFDSALYIWFLFLVFFGNWLLARHSRLRILWLLSASYFFYASWNWQLLGLILFSTVLDFTAGRKIHEAKSEVEKRLWLTASLVGNLGLLVLFKYGDFFLRSIRVVVEASGGSGADVPLLYLMLPVGISFYTFQTLSYTIDIYRGELEPVDSPLKFALFVSFFPQLVAGPIVRARNFLPQLAQKPKLSSHEQSEGLYLIAAGLIKKVAIADYIAINYVDRVFENPHMYSAVETLFGVYGYALQIYCDFSGYTDIAIGSALLLGFQLPENFNRPYIAASLREFWHRWHISLSSWLRDYLYIPLGGSHGSSLFTYRNLFITMLLGGLWHGASWNFVIWGAIHGLGLAATRMYQRNREQKPTERLSGPMRTIYEALCVVGTFHFVCFAWIFFRAPDFAAATAVLESIAQGTLHGPNVTPQIFVLIFVPLMLHLTPPQWEEPLKEGFRRMPGAVQAAGLLSIGVILQRVKAAEVVPFIYFQF